MLLLAIIIVTVIFSIVIYLSFQDRMAALIAWIVGSISGAAQRDSTNAQPEKAKAKPKNKKVRQRVKKPYEDPSFSTQLTTPIEDIIEESLQEIAEEPVAETSQPKKKNKQVKKAKTETDKNLKRTPSVEDSVGFSFFNPKSKFKSTNVSNEKLSQKNRKPVEEIAQIETEEIGFSFLPVKDKSKRAKASKAYLENDLLPKKDKKVKVESSIIQHYQVKEKKNLPVLAVEPVVHKKIVIPLVERKVEEIQAKPVIDLRPSKIVDASVSYANIVSDKIVKSEDICNNFGINEIVTDKLSEVQAELIRINTNAEINLEERLTNEVNHQDLLEIIENNFPEEIFDAEAQKIEANVNNLEPELNINGEEILQNHHSSENSLHEEEIEENSNSIADIVINSLAISEETDTTAEELNNNKDISKEPNLIEDNLKMAEVRVLTLNDQEHQDSTLYRLEKNWVLQFRLGPSLFGRKVNLYCNYSKKNSEFRRDIYKLLSWELDEGCENADDTAFYANLVVESSGSFHYYFTFENAVKAERRGSGFFLVDPILKYGQNEDLPLDCIQCQTVLAKNLGSFSTWENKLRVAKESGYNMIHFTPIQALGASNSCYSLSEQLELNPAFKKESGEMPTFADVETLLKKLRSDWKMTSICDIVLNHTANESEWLQKHPESTYNCLNCPYMRPAYLLDAAFHQFSMDVKKGLYQDRGIPAQVNSEDHLNAIRYHFTESVLKPLKIEELYICDVNKLVSEFQDLARQVPPSSEVTAGLELKLIQDSEYKRLASTIDINLALHLHNVFRSDCYDEDTRFKRCAEDFKNKLESLNQTVINQISDHLKAAVENTIATIRYFRVQHDGPKFTDITENNPLVYRYFTDHGTLTSLKEHEDLMYSPKGRFLMAHNGWVMNADPLKNFADADSNVYVRRDLIAWGDSVKLRYGDKPEDCPYLWNHMRQYVEQIAKIFDGVRLDNCHSTPIPVAEYLLDSARRVRPDLYVVAELFTNSDMTDNIFVNRLGITSLIREAMSAWDSHEQGRLVYRYGGRPVGSFYQPKLRPLVPSIAHALFLDLTHDNPSPVEKRTALDMLPSSALVNMACCASGSNRGYDEFVPHHIHVVDETREYAEFAEDDKLKFGNLKYVTKKTGIIGAKRALNELHFKLGMDGFDEVYVDQIDTDIVAVTRHCSLSHQSYILVAFTAFSQPGNLEEQRSIKPLRVEGVLDEIVLEASVSRANKTNEGFVRDSKWINGLSEYQLKMQEHIDVSKSNLVEQVDSNTPNMTQINFKNFKPGSVIVVKVSLPQDVAKGIQEINAVINEISPHKSTEVMEIIRKLSLADLNRVLYRCSQEERDEGHGFDTYNIPNFGSMVYAGLQGFMSLLSNIRPNNDLGHPMCINLRDGNWMLEYIWKRLKLDEGTESLGKWLESNTKAFKVIPRYLIPHYFDVLITKLYLVSIQQCYELMSPFVNNGSTFVRGLALGSVQFSAYIKSADLPTLSPNLAPPQPPSRVINGQKQQACASLSAGLPHFSVGYMRNWGRDTFIALRGLYILTGRFENARQHILGYAACLRHGLIPNLLDGGRNSRFNCRDAVWWWLYCIKEYCEEVPQGISILSDKVSRIFPTDDSEAQPPSSAVDQKLSDVIQEALNVHFQGLQFRERNAGRQIDEHMTDAGFNNMIGVDLETGFVYGGNEWNCGTWMDKMGSSSKAGNKGKPATPRDGSAVELIGLSKAIITYLDKLSAAKKYSFSGVERKDANGRIVKWTFKEWADKIQANFEKYYWIGISPVNKEPQAELINKRGIYKDTFGSEQKWTDYQLRCNFPIAMVVAPELFNPQHASIALQYAEMYLLGPLGMKTLDPEDWAYSPNYDNSDDSDNFKVANGFNYHQGPEWVWPVGFFLRAKLHFAAVNNSLEESVNQIKVYLANHFTELQTSSWRGLPELTNSDGSYCSDSSRTQAWSMSCILEVLHDLKKTDLPQSGAN